MKRTLPWSVALAAVLAVGCSGAKSTLSLSARAGAPLKAGAAATTASPVTVTEVKLTIRHLELKGVDAGGKEIEVEVGPIPVDITDFGSGAMHLVMATGIKPGTYTQLEAEIGDIAVTGKDTGGKDFTFTTSIEVEQEVCGTFNVAADGTLNFTFNIDTSSWFVDGSTMQPLDPTEANRPAIERNIARSFEVFEDANEDGQDDDCECGSSDGGSSGDSGGMSSSMSSSSEGGSGCTCSSACVPATTCLPEGSTCVVDSDCCKTLGCRPVVGNPSMLTCQAL